MAINPNTDFTAGAILTAAQQNRFPRGVMALSTLTANSTATTSESTRTSLTFTAVANRYYKITWFEGEVTNGANASNNTMYLRQTSTTGTILGTTIFYYGLSSEFRGNFCSVVTTFAAGSQSIFARILTNAGTNTTYKASATSPAFLMVEDVGPA
jgi:hypothetical protein